MFRNKVVLVLIGLLTAFSMAACKKQLSGGDTAPLVSINPAQIYYTQFSLFQEKNNFRTTNYRKGILIPVNTAATLVSMNAKEAEVRLADSGQTLTIENVPKHTGDDMQTAFDKIFATTKIDLNRFSAAERDAISSGRAIAGMSRDAVITAIGYPPKNQTPSLSMNDWTYWNNRFDRFIVHFKNDKVESIVE
ncbi:hypothetical protein [Methylomonas sp. MgM2]